MHILMLTSTLPRYEGDSQANFVGEQAEAWVNARADDTITIVAPHDKGAARSEIRSKVEVRRFRYFIPSRLQKLAYPAILPNLRRNPALALQLAPFLLAQYRVASRVVSARQSGLVYAHWAIPQGLVAYSLKRLHGVPYVLQNHSSDLFVLNRLGSVGRKVAQVILREASHFFCVNAEQKEAAIEMLKPSERKAFSAKCTVLPMGVVFSDRLNGIDTKFDIGTISRLSRKKGIDRFITALEELTATGIAPSAIIAGDGEERAALQKLVVRSDTHFAGFLSGNKKNAFMETCGRFAFPAKASNGDVEGLPVALLEALCTGRPVLASADTNITLLPEWEELKNHVEFLKDPDNDEELLECFLDLLQRPANVNENQAALVSRYRWDRLIEEYLRPIEILRSRSSTGLTSQK